MNMETQSSNDSTFSAEVVFVNGNNFGYDEYFCFHINDFKIGDSIEFLSSPGRRTRGVVTKVNKKNLGVFFLVKDGAESSCHINDVTYLSEKQRGWLK
jgi:hypothetical protein